MRTTVGPLPSAVYWRRRAVVLAALLLVIVGMFWSCSTRSNGDKGRRSGAASATSPAPATTTPDPSESILTPETGNPGLGVPVQPAATTGAPVPAPAVSTSPSVALGATCTDAEISVTPVPARTTTARRQVLDIRLKIKNISVRTCTRDVGADLQEIFIKQGARTVWSSDTCGTARGSDVQPFSPNLEREYRVAWNGKDASRCANGLAAGPDVPAGAYDVLGRLGTRLSAPVRLVLV
jgi:hypothetical protein